MQTYSDFFTSGFRAVTNRARRPSSSRKPLDFGIAPNVVANTNTSGFAYSSTPSSSSTGAGRRTLADITQRSRPRPTSMIVQDTIPKSPTTATAREKGRRRSSFVSFSSRLFDRMTTATTPFDENSSMFSNSSRKSASSKSSRALNDDPIPELWVTTGGPHTPSAPNGSPLIHHSIDPFTSSASPSTKSLFIDLSTSPYPSPAGTPKRESFLSLTSTSSNRSSVILTSSSNHNYTHAPTRKRERPTSIQTMPLPSRSRASSFSFPYTVPGVGGRGAGQEKDRENPNPRERDAKADFFWIVEEEPSSALEPELSSGMLTGKGRFDEEVWDAPATIDWRQFHIDLLTTEDGA